MAIITIDTDKLHWCKMTGTQLDWVNEVDISNAIISEKGWIPVDYDSYPKTYPKPFQEVWITDTYDGVSCEVYNGKRDIKAWMPYIIPEPYKEESEDEV